MADPILLEWLKLAIALVALASGLLTILTLVLRSTVLKERTAAKERHSDLAVNGAALIEANRTLATELKQLRSQLETNSSELSSLRNQYAEQIFQLDSIRKAFGGYFEVTRKQMAALESRLSVVEKQTDQVITVGKDMAARIRGKAGNGGR